MVILLTEAIQKGDFPRLCKILFQHPTYNIEYDVAEGDLEMSRNEDTMAALKELLKVCPTTWVTVGGMYLGRRLPSFQQTTSGSIMDLYIRNRPIHIDEPSAEPVKYKAQFAQDDARRDTPPPSPEPRPPVPPSLQSSTVIWRSACAGRERGGQANWSVQVTKNFKDRTTHPSLHRELPQHTMHSFPELSECRNSHCSPERETAATRRPVLVLEQVGSLADYNEYPGDRTCQPTGETSTQSHVAWPGVKHINSLLLNAVLADNLQKDNKGKEGFRLVWSASAHAQREPRSSPALVMCEGQSHHGVSRSRFKSQPSRELRKEETGWVDGSMVSEDAFRSAGAGRE
ncbi:hypothetical protein M427DRAFT_45238 [Gonapodya prolifera JEL478]|uniref:Uncharacterized protein n=1 Tax=Gonapodya prolifera (strain JEL478) TaxID=1344416 RepID=A0A139ABJ7_GONPJ|nr:hypothetical protein M427DRAFT_45238 [Gonapodya prolifera JEL478]|eukprot:KXS14176.1 hypothetical protein M427DRAFT_45238 [Gonapodya prolifera JEL478]